MPRIDTATCQDCGWRGPVEDTKEFRHLYERVHPGDVMPAGDCPEEGCGAAAMLDDERRDADDLRPAMVALMLGLDRLHDSIGTGDSRAPIGVHVKELADYARPPHAPNPAPRPGPFRGGAFVFPAPARTPPMPDIDIHASTAPTGPPPAIHPMDPARGNNLSPAFAAVLAWAIGRPAMTEPAITGVVVSGGCVFAATTASPFHDTLIGSWPDLEANLRAWGAACAAGPAVVDNLVAKVRGASR